MPVEVHYSPLGRMDDVERPERFEMLFSCGDLPGGFETAIARWLERAGNLDSVYRLCLGTVHNPRSYLEQRALLEPRSSYGDLPQEGPVRALQHVERFVGGPVDVQRRARDARLGRPLHRRVGPTRLPENEKVLPSPGVNMTLPSSGSIGPPLSRRSPSRTQLHAAMMAPGEVVCIT